MKYIGKYDDMDAVKAALNSDELGSPYTVLTLDDYKVHYGTYNAYGKVGDVVVEYNGVLGLIPREEYSLSTYPIDVYVPVGMVMEGASKANDDVSTIVAFKSINLNDPDNGKIGFTSYTFGPRGVNLGANSRTDEQYNAERILSFATHDPDWRTAEKLTSGEENGNYAMAECAWRFHTPTTNQGDWAIPAIDTLTTFIGLKSQYNDLMKMLSYPIIDFPSYQYLFSSTEKNSDSMEAYKAASSLTYTFKSSTHSTVLITRKKVRYI